MNMKFSFEERINEQNKWYLVSLWRADIFAGVERNVVGSGWLNVKSAKGG
jgi:hypothetical protein